MSDSLGLPEFKAAFAGHREGRFQIDNVIASGGMGTVLRATDRSMRFRPIPCAIKVIHPNMLHDEATRVRFQLESQIMDLVKHEGVVEVYDDGVLENGWLYIVMEWVDGKTLDRLVRARPLTPSQAVELFIGLCPALEHAHANRVIHRDLKPANIMVTPDGHTKIADFGVAKFQTKGESLTQTGFGMGTPEFGAPELFVDAKTADVRADIFSLGITLLVSLTGKHPPNLLNHLISHTLELYQKLFEQMCEGIPLELVEIIQRAAQRRPEDRYQSVAEWREALCAVREHLPAAEPIDFSFDEVADAATSSPSLPSLPSLPLLPPVSSTTSIPHPSEHPSPVDVFAPTMAAGWSSHTEYGRELNRVSQKARARAGIAGAVLAVGGLFAWWWLDSDSNVQVTSTAPTTVATTSPATASPAVVPDVATEPPTVSPKEEIKPDVVIAKSEPDVQVVEDVQPPQAEIEVPKVVVVTPEKPKPASLAPPNPEPQKPSAASESVPIVIEIAKEPDLPKASEIPKAVEVPKASETAKTAETVKAPEAVKAPEIVMETTQVNVSFPEDRMNVWLIGSSGRHNLPGAVPPGTYKVMGQVVGVDAGEPTAMMSSLTVVSGKPIRLTCDSVFAKCTAH